MASTRRSIRLPVHRRTSVPAVLFPAEEAAGQRRELRLGTLRWIDVIRPTPRDSEELGAEFGFHELAIEDSQSRVQRPKLDDYDEYLFLVLQFPVYHKVTRKTVAAEVNIYVGRDYVITLHDGTLKPILRLFDRASQAPDELGAELEGASGRLLYEIVDELVDYCFPIVNKVGQNIDRVERMIFDEDQSPLETVQEISVLRRDIIALRRIVRPEIGILSQLERKQPTYLGEDIDVYFGDLLDHVSKLWDALEDYRDVVEGLTYTNDSLTSHRLNEIIKVLTILSVVMLPLTVITSFYGMNVPLPFADSPWTTTAIAVFMLAVAGGMFAYFRAKRWL